MSLTSRVNLRRTIAVATLGSLLMLTACSTDEISSRADGARSSAGAIASAAGSADYKRACVAARDELATLGSLAGRLAADPSLRVQLAPRVTATVKRLAEEIGGSSAEWRAVLDGAGGLAEAVRDANEAGVRLAASQAVLAIRVAQAGCTVATR
jgi:hypothetical protein